MSQEGEVSKCILILGCMFSGKTDKLISLYNEFSAKGMRCVALKPGIDTRYSEAEIVSHSGARLCAVSTNDITRVNVDDMDCLFIDEGQFVANIARFVEQYLTRHPMGKTIWISGLSEDAFGHAWSSISDLLKLNPGIVTLHGVCSKCGSPSSHSAKYSYSNSAQVEIGGADKYWPACDACFAEILNSIQS